MREANYNATLTTKLVKEYGGRAIKLADRATLGLPDSLHIKNGFATFIECKIGKLQQILKLNDRVHCRLWDCVNDRRQYQVCKTLSKNALVLYCIYWPDICMSAVVTLGTLEIFEDKQLLLKEGKHLVMGHGVDAVIRIIEERRKRIYETLNGELGIKAEGISS